MQVVAQEQAAAAAAPAAKREINKQRQVSKVLEASRLRAERATRVAKLKVGFTFDPNPQTARLLDLPSVTGFLPNPSLDC